MAWVFVRLKVSLIAGSLRGSTGRTIGFVAGLVLAAALGIGGFVLTSMMRLIPEQAEHVGVLLSFFLVASWIALPLIRFGVDETLDPTRLALLPIRPLTAAVGLLAASATGPVPIACLLVLLGMAVGLSGGPLSIVVGVLAALCVFALCIVGSRAVTVSMAGLLRSRRGGDIALLAGVGVFVAFQFANIALQRASFGDTTAFLAEFAEPLSWTPPGMAAAAITAARDGRPLASAALLAAAVGTVLLLGWWWHRLLARSLVTYDASTQSGGTRRGAGFGTRIPWVSARTAGAAARELRYAWRDPRRKANWIMALVVAGIVVFSTTGAVADAIDLQTMVLTISVTATIVGMQGANQFGQIGGSLWMQAVATERLDQVRADVAGVNLAIAIIGVPILVLVAAAMAVVSGEYAALPGTLAAGLAVGGVALGLANLASVYIPYRLPERRSNPFAGPSGGQGLTIMLGSMVSLLGTALLSTPVTYAVLNLDEGYGPLLLAAGACYGAAVAWAGRRLTGRRAYARYPELLADLARAS
ncbi:hypothetical protein [Allonocardiopsis opalescens]|uniref:ABC-2 type transport system permease protein n=1 Tax=Allonocardiopsis opalescens TaxID=1144618 RepID=A0A2T0QC25_9ACTN|nr:hypothetical protein [Allonocardiopsis opalescens]PRY01431.1 ABC-2 type transport system permease protein [Allonocardiopsis opalescens]